MKEIDFLPKWYRSGRQRQVSYRTQYVALACIFVVMVVWSLLTSRLISTAEAQLARAKSKLLAAESTSQQFNEIKTELTQLQKKASITEKIDSKIDVAKVLAEIGFLIDEKMVLSKVEFDAERFADQQGRQTASGSAVRIARAGFGSKEALVFGDVRFKVVIAGMATEASNVAEFICRLENSPYFQQVCPSFSRDKEIKTAGRFAKNSAKAAEGNRKKQQGQQVSEFEISCYLANYRQNETCLVKEAQSRSL